MARIVEKALNFGDGARLVGVLTRPVDSLESEHPDLALIILNAGVLHRVGPCRLHVRVARAVAAHGLPVLRFDLPGVGDSSGLDHGGSLLDEVLTGIRQALDLLQSQSIAGRYAVFGLCSGADHAFAIACADPRVVGAVMVDPQVVLSTSKARLLRLARWIARPRGWVRLILGRYRLLAEVKRRLPGASYPGTGESSMTRKELHAYAGARLAELMARDVRLCYVMTGRGRPAYRYQEQLFDAFPDLDLRGRVQVEMMRKADHTFLREEHRQELVAKVTSWLGAMSAAPEP